MVSEATKSKNSKFDRLHVLGGAFFIMSLVIVWRLFDLQILKGATKQAEARTQRAVAQELTPDRGEIYTIASIHNQIDLQPLAVNEQRYEIYAIPNEIEDPVNAAKQLADILELNGDEEIDKLAAKLSKEDDPYEPVKHEVTLLKMRAIEAAELQGIYNRPETARYYPMKETFGHITGFLGYKDNERIGQYGMEGFLNNLLSGTEGFIESEQDPAGRMIALGDRQLIPAVDGADFVLTIDPNIQQKTCDIIKKYQEKYEAEKGTIIVMEPDTGKIRSMCTEPGFDPNIYNEVEDIDIYINPAVTGAYEPGSIFKAVTMAAALDSGSVEAGTKYTDTGKVEIGDDTIRNADDRIYGEQDMSQVLENSVNTGSVFAAMRTGHEIFRNYVKAFGFGQPTDIEFPAESAGDISSLEKNGDIFLATGSFGQGISVTPIQMIRAFAAIANQGKLVKPHVLSEVRQADGQVIKIEPEVIRQVISPKTAAILGAMLVNVLEKGYGESARVQGFYLAGKTGTAQVAGNQGYSDQTIHSFVGFGPISEPKFVVLVKLDKPAWGSYSANTVAPAFAEISSFLLQYYQVQPER